MFSGLFLSISLRDQASDFMLTVKTRMGKHSLWAELLFLKKKFPSHFTLPTWKIMQPYHLGRSEWLQPPAEMLSTPSILYKLQGSSVPRVSQDAEQRCHVCRLQHQDIEFHCWREASIVFWECCTYHLYFFIFYCFDYSGFAMLISETFTILELHEKADFRLIETKYGLVADLS